MIGCGSGVLVWTVDPLSVVARPSAACVSFLSQDLVSHLPVTSLTWNPQGTLLLTTSASDTSMYVWNTASEKKIPLKRIGENFSKIDGALCSRNFQNVKLRLDFFKL